MIVDDIKTICGVKENFSETASVNFCNAEIAKTEFGNIQLADSENIAYFPFKLCHSMPKINKRGRAFMPKVLANSFASALDQLIDVEHLIKTNKISDGDKITGFIKAIKFDGEPNLELANDSTIIPAKAIPVKGLGALFLRADGARDIVKEHNKHKNWRVSMECAHNWDEAYFYYRDNLIPIADAEKGMIDCIHPGKVLPYKGHELAVCLGGLTNKVDFWGAAVTKTPADGDADIEGKIFSLVSGISHDIASTKRFYMPLKEYTVSKKDYSEDKLALEIASQIEELASIGIIGQTDAAPDGHFHYILSDLTVMPASGHDHWGTKFSISPGTNPTLTGVTDNHSMYVRNPDTGLEERIAHTHLINLSLKKKFKVAGNTADSDVNNPAMDDSETSSEYTVSKGNEDMTKELLKLTQETNSLVAKLVSAKTEEERTKIGQEIASSNEKIAKLAAQEVADEEITAAIDKKIESGELLTKDQVEKITADKVAEAEAKAKAESEQKEKENARIELIKTSNLNMDYLIGETKVSDLLAGIPFDDGGEKNFKTQIAMLAKIPDALVNNSSVNAEAANQNATKATPDYTARIKALAGGGNVSEETANEDDSKFKKTDGSYNRVTAGRKMFSKV